MNRLEISAKACTFLLLVLNSLTTPTIAENGCLCQFNNVNCTRLVENDTIFYSTAEHYDVRFDTPIIYSTANNVKSSGIIKCWKSSFKPVLIEIEKCEYGRTFHEANDPYKSPKRQYMGYITEKSDIISKISVCLVDHGINIRWLEKYDKSDIISSVEVILNFPEKVQLISVRDVPMNFDVLRKFTTVKYLSMINVQLKQIPSNFLKTAGKLVAVSFSHNSIKEIRAESFVNQNYLEILQLNHNAIEILGVCTINETNNFLVNLKQLKKLFLAHNRISKICPNFFQYSLWLSVIDLSYNKIVTLNGVFVAESYKYTMEIDLSRNFLEYISDRDFLFFPNLLRLDLSHNRIRFIDKFAFVSMGGHISYTFDASHNFLNSSEFLLPLKHVVEKIYLNNNNLKSFPELSELETFPAVLDLKGNHISYIAFTKLSLGKDTSAVTSINLEDNTIKTVDFHVPYIPNWTLVRVRLNNNPLTCDCLVKPLHKFITRGNSMLNDRLELITDKLYCHQPQSLRNVSLADVKEWFLQCAEEYRCPLNCSCQFSPTGTMVNCNYVGGITESDVMEFKQLKNLITLSLENNKLVALPPLMLDGLIQLSTLKLGHNLFIKLPEGILTSLPHLFHFSVNNNQMEILSNSIFQHNEELQVINVCCNKLKMIKLNISHLHELNYVDFSDNSIQHVEIQWPDNVKEILLNGNRIKTINLINIPVNLHRVDFSRNRFDHVDLSDLDQFVHTNATFDFSNNLITAVSETGFGKPNNDESVIILNNNPLHCDCKLKCLLDYVRKDNDVLKKYIFKTDNLYCDSPESMKSKLFEHLNVSQLPCEQDQCAVNYCQCYEQVAFDYRILECSKFPDGSLVGVFNELYIQDGNTRNLGELSSPEWESLNTVKIQKLNDTVVTSAPFLPMKNLTAVTIINNKNLQFSSNVFSNLSALINLDLHSSGIRDLQPNSFQRNFRMENLNLSFNLLSSLPRDIFVDLTNLQTIDLSGNDLTHLQSNLCENLRNVKTLILKQNSLQHLETSIFFNCSSLQNLDLSVNLITSHDLRSLLIPPQITKIVLSRNLISSIENSWSEKRHLQLIDLRSNSITVLNVSQLIQFPTNTDFKLQNNSISNVIWFVRNYTKKNPFVTVNLENNPFVCDCNLKHFVQSANQRYYNNLLRIDDYHKLMCAQPLELNGTSLSEIVNENLYCNLENCSNGCICRYYSNIEISVVECNVTNETDLRICPDVVNELYLRGNLSVTFLKNDCWKLLKKLYVTHNSFIAKISNDLLQNHELLIELGLTRNQMRQVPSKLFQFTPNIEVVDFSNNLLDELSSQIFDKLFRLKKIDAVGNRFKLINWEIPLSVESFNLAENRIESVAIPKLNDHYQLKIFNLSNNRLEMVPNTPDFLFYLKHLQILDLSHNNIAIDCNDRVAFFPKSLQSLNLSHNLLRCSHLWNEYYKPTSRLNHFDLSHNQIVSLRINDFLFSNNSELVLIMQNCSFSNYMLSVTYAKNVTCNLMLGIDISNNKHIECDCNIRHYNDIKRIQNGSLTLDLKLVTNSECKLSNFEINLNLISKFDLIPDVSYCSVIENCPTHCFCLKSNAAIHIFCVEKGFTSLPSSCPFNVQYINMDYNNVSIVKDLSHPNWNNIITISLRHNKIRSILTENLSSLQFLQFVFLDGNLLYSPSGWLEYFVSENILPFNITLSDNPWSCTCDNELFQKWVTNFLIRNVILDVADMNCSDGNLFINVDMCPSEIVAILVPVLTVFCVIIIVLILIVFYYRKKTLVHAWCYSKNMCGCCVNEAEIDVDKEYDAFLSYCEEDEQYVTRELLPGLEERQPFYKVCVHQRDWKAGEPIVEQIENSVKNSRRTIIVLSPNFTKSTWANVEFRVANLQSLEDKINRVIAIVLDEDFLTDDLDPEFKAYLSMTTYLKAEDPQFWNKLRYAMPHKAPVRKNARKKMSNLNLNLVEAEDTV